MTYDASTQPGSVGTVTSAQLWQRVDDFLTALVPVAEEAGIRLATHPDDRPLTTLRGAARLVIHPDLYQTLLAIYPSHSAPLAFCQG